MKIKEIIQKFLQDLWTKTETKKDDLSVKVYENSSGVQFTLEEFVDQYNPEDIQKGQANFVFSISAGSKVIGRFILQDMVNCSGIIIHSDVLVSKYFTNRGIGTLIDNLVIEFCKYYGYGIIQATDKDTNEFQKRIFVKNGWKLMHSFKNPKTANPINVWMYFLSE